jgi:two-component system, NtrC family, response regulator HydG
VEKEMIVRPLEEAGGNRTHAARILGISRRTLQLKLKAYGINE